MFSGEPLDCHRSYSTSVYDLLSSRVSLPHPGHNGILGATPVIGWIGGPAIPGGPIGPVGGIGAPIGIGAPGGPAKGIPGTASPMMATGPYFAITSPSRP